MRASGAGLYVHVPFCARKCAYCDFNSYAGMEGLVAGYLSALRGEMRARAGEVERVPTVYVGGGTPSHLPEGCLESLLDEIRGAFALRAAAEVTLEANPADLDAARLRSIRAAGFNRISIGVQSFDDDVLRFLGRRHDARQARDAVQMARRAGFENVSIDLIYAVPGQPQARWERTVEEAIALLPEHLSAYSLTVEAGTPLGALVERGDVLAVGDDVQADMYEAACAMLAAAGYEHYEISNFARPGFRCRHNETYWRNEEYLGLGAGAHSYLGGIRWWNVRAPGRYGATIADGTLPVAGAERLSAREQMSETLMLALRTSDGITEEALERRFGKDLWGAHRSTIAAEAATCARLQGGTLSLPRSAFVIADAVCEALV